MSADDVVLCARRSPSLMEFITTQAQELHEEKEGGHAEKTQKTRGRKRKE